MGSCSSRHRQRARTSRAPPESPKYHHLRTQQRPDQPTSFDREGEYDEGDSRPGFSDAPDPSEKSMPEAKPVFKQPPGGGGAGEPVMGYPVTDGAGVLRYPTSPPPAPPPAPSQPPQPPQPSQPSQPPQPPTLAPASESSQPPQPYYPAVPFADRAIRPYPGPTTSKTP